MIVFTKHAAQRDECKLLIIKPVHLTLDLSKFGKQIYQKVLTVSGKIKDTCKPVLNIPPCQAVQITQEVLLTL